MRVGELMRMRSGDTGDDGASPLGVVVADDDELCVAVGVGGVVDNGGGGCAWCGCKCDAVATDVVDAADDDDDGVDIIMLMGIVAVGGVGAIAAFPSIVWCCWC